MACTSERATAIGELAGGRLGPEALEELLRHVEGCPACSEALDAAAALAAVAPGAPGAPSVARRRRAPLLTWPLAAAAAAALIVWLGPALLRGDPAARVRRLADLTPVRPPESVLRGAGGEEADAAWSAAMESLRRGAWAEAAATLAALEQAGDERALLRLYLGQAYAQLGELDAAAEALAAAADSSEGLLQQRALWSLAQVHLARGEGAAASAVLERIVASGGEYAPNARAQLAELAPILGR